MLKLQNMVLKMVVLVLLGLEVTGVSRIRTLFFNNSSKKTILSKYFSTPFSFFLSSRVTK